MFRKTLGSRTWLIAVLMFATTYPVIASADREGPIPQGSMTTTPPNIVLILTDDQRADTLRFMPNVQRLLVRNGIAFTNGYVVNPVCCPSRASTLTGDYSHTTMVYTNHPGRPFGGFPAFDDDSTIGTWLQDGGYHTGLFGKYLNGYGTNHRSHPGGTYSLLLREAVSFIRGTDPAQPLFMDVPQGGPEYRGHAGPAPSGCAAQARGTG
jgi:arylsulfatase A-like enzyme